AISHLVGCVLDWRRALHHRDDGARSNGRYARLGPTHSRDGPGLGRAGQGEPRCLRRRPNSRAERRAQTPFLYAGGGHTGTLLYGRLEPAPAHHLQAAEPHAPLPDEGTVRCDRLPQRTYLLRQGHAARPRWTHGTAAKARRPALSRSLGVAF